MLLLQFVNGLVLLDGALCTGIYMLHPRPPMPLVSKGLGLGGGIKYGLGKKDKKGEKQTGKEKDEKLKN